MQIAVIEAARDLCGLQDANSREFSPEAEHCVIDLMADQKGEVPKGGTMRLGAYPCRLQEGSRLRGIYGCSEIRAVSYTHLDVYKRQSWTFPAKS